MEKLTFKNRKQTPAHRLPFTGNVPGHLGLSFWAVPAAGGYHNGVETGRALAVIYLKHLKEHGQPCGGGILRHIAIDMLIDRGETDNEDVCDSIRGQAVGFFSVLDEWLTGAARHLGCGLDSMDAKELLATAKDGLCGAVDYWARVDLAQAKEVVK